MLSYCNKNNSSIKFNQTPRNERHDNFPSFVDFYTKNRRERERELRIELSILKFRENKETAQFHLKLKKRAQRGPRVLERETAD